MRRTSLFLSILACAAATAGAQSKPSTSAAKPATTRPVWPDEGPMKWAPRPTVSDITANDLRTRLYQFADDSMQGRRIGELGNYKGTAYIASEFKRLGLKPAGENGTFFQDMPYGPIGFDSAATRLIAGPPLDPALGGSARIALDAARAIGAIDLGQSVVVSGSRPIAAEDTGGTDALLKRVTELRIAGLTGNSGMPLILAKARKPRQPSFVDLPAIGAQTVVNAAAAGISVIVIEARGTLLLDRAEIAREAAARAVTVVGLRNG